MKETKPILSCIVPYVLEYPQIVFTLRSICEELKGRVPFEIIAVDNYCEYVQKQAPIANKIPDRGTGMVKGMATKHSWLKYARYDEKLSHWNAKNLGVANAQGEFLWFCDSHCIVGRDSLYNMFTYWKDSEEHLNGTIHLPLTYHILEDKKLIYSMKANAIKGIAHYTFSGYRNEKAPYEVPCMSTCGMLMHRSVFDKLGGWPKQMGIYGGGENFINYTQAILGMKKWIMPGNSLFHHGEKRRYHYNWTDYQRNRIIANYMFGGEKWAVRWVENSKNKRGLYTVLTNIIDSLEKQRAHIISSQMTTIEEWLKKWRK